MAKDLRTECAATAATTGRIRDGKNEIVHNVSFSNRNESMHPTINQPWHTQIKL